jgi:hypothetical protein
MQMKFKYILVAAALAIGAFFAKQQYDENVRERNRAEQWRKSEDTARAAVISMIERYRAITTWEAELADELGFRLNPVLTVELERLWIGPRPILFLGQLDDISSRDGGGYIVRVKHGLLKSDYHFNSSLRVQLDANSELIDRFLTNYLEDWRNESLLSSVAVIAEVRAITASDEHGESGELSPIRTGHGTLLDIAYLGSFDVTTSNFRSSGSRAK